MAKLGALETALRQVVENAAPGGLALAAHVLDGEQHLLPVAPHPEHDEQRDRRGLPVEPHLDDGAVEDEPHDVLGQIAPVPALPVGLDLPPHARDRRLGDRAAKDRRQGTAYAPSVGAGEIGTRDQRIDLAGAPAVGRQGLVDPLGRPPVGGSETRARHRHRHRAEAAQHLALAPPVAVACRGHSAGRTLIAEPSCRRRTRARCGLETGVAPTSKCCFQLLLDQRLDEAADRAAHAGFERCGPPLLQQVLRICSRDIPRHGVVSVGGHEPPFWLSDQAGDNATSDSNQSWDGTHGRSSKRLIKSYRDKSTNHRAPEDPSRNARNSRGLRPGGKQPVHSR